MHPNQRPKARQQKRVRAEVGQSDAYAFFNLLTGPQLLERVEAVLPAHRERVFPPTETLSMFLSQALSADGSCRLRLVSLVPLSLFASLCRFAAPCAIEAR
jgi:hypothetical protein